jgi:hypothetical protein
MFQLGRVEGLNMIGVKIGEHQLPDRWSNVLAGYLLVLPLGLGPKGKAR